jgi:aconitate hydratase 2/2-methylisocitrate dehydratase
VIAEFKVKSDVLFDEVRAGGRIPLIVGRGLTAKARAALGLPPSTLFRLPQEPANTGKGYTLAQKIVGRACGLPEANGDQVGVRPGTYCEPHMTSVGSQDTTGPMTRDELKDLACLGFSADLVMQSFCHTAAYPKPVDVKTHHELPDFISTRGGVSLRPGDGVIHSWLNRLLLPDTVGTGGRQPHALSDRHQLPGRLRPGRVRRRDRRDAARHAGERAGPLQGHDAARRDLARPRQRDPALRDQGRPADGREEGQEEHLQRPHPRDRRAAGPEGRAGVRALRRVGRAQRGRLHRAPEPEPIVEYIRSNVALMKWMIANGYAAARTLQRRIDAQEAWLADPKLLAGDADAEYAAVIEIDLAEIHEPIVACPNDPDDVKTLSDVAGAVIDEVFIGSCMTNIGHFRAASKLLEGKRDIPVKLWVAPPTKMDANQLSEEGHYGVLGTAGARMEMPGCSLCMGNQAQVREGATGVLDQHAQLPEPARQERERLPRLGRAGGDLLEARTHPEPGRVPRRGGGAR